MRGGKNGILKASPARLKIVKIAMNAIKEAAIAIENGDRSPFIFIKIPSKGYIVNISGTNTDFTSAKGVFLDFLKQSSHDERIRLLPKHNEIKAYKKYIQACEEYIQKAIQELE